MGAQLLIDEPPLVVLPSLAIRLGSVNRAIVLQQIHYWCGRSTNIHDGHRWVYQTYEEWGQQFPWISESGIKSIIADLEKKGILISGCYNKLPFDRTKWYRIDYATLDQTVSVPSSDGGPSNGQSVSDEQTVSVPSDDAVTVRPIPETTETPTETPTEIATSAHSSMEKRAPIDMLTRNAESVRAQYRPASTPPDPAPTPNPNDMSGDALDRLKEFRRAYPSHRSSANPRELAVLWAGMSDVDQRLALSRLAAWNVSDEWADGKYVPNIKKFLEEERWLTEPKAKADTYQRSGYGAFMAENFGI